MTKINSVEQVDIEATRAVAPFRRTRPIAWLGWLSEAADQPQLIAISAATIAVGVLSGRSQVARTGMRMLAAELVATGLKMVVKQQVDRTRPRVLDDGGHYRMSAGHDEASAMNSFPSGHTAGAVAVARAIARGHPAHAGAAGAAATAVALIQVPRCQHYPTDLLAGAAIGLAADGVVRLAEAAAQRLMAPGDAANPVAATVDAR